MTPLLLVLWLSFTNPSEAPTPYRAWDPDLGDSVTVLDCYATPGHSVPVRQLRKIVLWRRPFSAATFSPVDSLDATGREGLRDSFPIAEDGDYQLWAWNTAGRSPCPASLAIWMPRGVIVGVAGQPAPPAVARVEVFDVRGRRVASMARSGVYFVRTTWTDGRLTVRKVVHLK